jgi:hypothetical protein
MIELGQGRIAGLAQGLAFLFGGLQEFLADAKVFVQSLDYFLG